jgi:tRNA(Ile)-lysidine synthase
LGAFVTRGPEGLSIATASLLSPVALDSNTASMPNSEAQSALTQRLVRRILQELQGDRRRLTARHVEQIVHLAKQLPTGSRVELPHGLVVQKRFDRLVFLSPEGARDYQKAESGQAAASYSYQVELPRVGASVIDVAETGKRVWLKLIDWPLPERDTRGLGNVLDAELLRPPLVFRNWRSGDAYRPKGRRHDRKLKRLLEGKFLSARDRVGWPVLTSAGQLAWVRGLPAAAEFAATAGTRTGLVITEEPR